MVSCRNEKDNQLNYYMIHCKDGKVTERKIFLRKDYSDRIVNGEGKLLKAVSRNKFRAERIRYNLIAPEDDLKQRVNLKPMKGVTTIVQPPTRTVYNPINGKYEKVY